LAAVPVLAASSQWLDFDENSPTQQESSWHSGNHVYIYVNNAAPTWNWGDMDWQLIDGNFNVIASGTATTPYDINGNPNNNGESYVTADLPLDSSNLNEAKLIVTCTSLRCQGDAYIETQD
jgi:hypothetical protein